MKIDHKKHNSQDITAAQKGALHVTIGALNHYSAKGTGEEKKMAEYLLKQIEVELSPFLVK